VIAAAGDARVGRSMWGTPLALAVVALVAVALSDPSSAAASTDPGPARIDASPVNLSAPIDLAEGMAHRSAIVRSGGARIEVISSTLFRLEYSPTGRFENLPTVNAVDRRRPVPSYRAPVTGGWLVVRTGRATLRYRVGSGPFTAGSGWTGSASVPSRRAPVVPVGTTGPTRPRWS
jgi:hypothetical protein